MGGWVEAGFREGDDGETVATVAQEGIPRRLKPSRKVGVYGTVEAVPLRLGSDSNE